MKIGWCDAANSAGVYQSRAYGEAVSLSTMSRWRVIGDDDGRWRVPLCIDSPSSGLKDATSPYGYPGIYAAPGLSGGEITNAWEQTRQVLMEHDVVSVLFRFSPYRDNIEQWHHDLEGLETVLLSETIGVELSHESAMWDAMEGRSRTAVRRAEKEGMTVSIFEADDSLASADSDFRRLYDQTMERVGAAPHHWHPDGYYRSLVEGLEPGMQIAQVHNADGDVVAACLLLIDLDGVHYHLSGSLQDAARQGANNLMIWSALKWAAANGHSMMHLGGGTGKNDSLFRFKSSFGGQALPYYVGRLITNPEAYSRLVSARAKEIDASELELSATGFFPAYRAMVIRGDGHEA